MPRLLFAAVALGLALAGCQRSTPEPTTAPSVGPLTQRLKGEGDALMAEKVYDKAIVKYQMALNEAPNDVPIRYALAVALSYLPARREEAVEQFRLVLARATPGSPEATAAREWLAAAKELEPAASSTASAGGSGAAPASATGAGNVAKSDVAKKGRLMGKILWQDIEPRGYMVHVNISITGEDLDTRDVKLGREFMIGRVYEFRELPPGDYRLVAQVGSTTMWDMKVTIAPEKDTAMDLTDGNAVAPRDYRPPSG